MVYVQGGALVDQCAVANQAQQDSELQKYREVELSGLEPLTSCMPVSHRHVRGRRHTLRQLRKH